MRKIDADKLPFMKANLKGVYGDFERGYNQCLETIQNQILNAPIVIDEIVKNESDSNLYQKYYENLYNLIRNAIGEERYQEAKEEVLSSGNSGINTILVVAINKLVDDVDSGGFTR